MILNSDCHYFVTLNVQNDHATVWILLHGTMQIIGNSWYKNRIDKTVADLLLHQMHKVIDQAAALYCHVAVCKLKIQV